jgi:hypothetical protein
MGRKVKSKPISADDLEVMLMEQLVGKDCSNEQIRRMLEIAIGEEVERVGDDQYVIHWGGYKGPARSGKEAQHAWNDVFPGDPHPYKEKK